MIPAFKEKLGQVDFQMGYKTEGAGGSTGNSDDTEKKSFIGIRNSRVLSYSTF